MLIYLILLKILLRIISCFLYTLLNEDHTHEGGVHVTVGGLSFFSCFLDKMEVLLYFTYLFKFHFY